MKILCCPYGGRSDGPSLRFAGVFGEWSAAEVTENPRTPERKKRYFQRIPMILSEGNGINFRDVTSQAPGYILYFLS